MKSLLVTVVPIAPLPATVGELVAIVLAAEFAAEATAVVAALFSDAAAESTCLATAASMAFCTPPQPVWAAARTVMAKIRLTLMPARAMVFATRISTGATV